MDAALVAILDLDPAARAHDQRVVPLAIGRFAIVVGATFILVGLWPPINLDFVLLGVGAILFNTILSLPFWHPRATWVAVGGGISAVVLSVLLLVNATLGLTVAARIAPPVQVDAALREGLAIANEGFDGSPWMIARAIAALLSVLLAIELCSAGIRLILVGRNERELLVERAPGPLTWLFGPMLDFPPEMIRYSGLLVVGGVLLLLPLTSTLPFFFAVTNIAGGAFLDNFLALVQVIDCVDAQTDLDVCIKTGAWTHAFGMCVLALSSLFLLPAIGTWLSRLVRKPLARSAMKQFERDFETRGAGNAILFLRSKDDDSVAFLPRDKWRLIRNALSQSVWLSNDLDYLLAAEGMLYGVPVGLGKGTEVSFGAIRIIASDADEHDMSIEERTWAQKVKELAQQSQRIILVVDDSIRSSNSEGLRWELCHLARHPELLAKTTILVKTGIDPDNRPSRNPLDKYRNLWLVIEELSGLSPPPSAKPVIGLSFSANGCCTALLAERFYATTALLSLRFALRGIRMTQSTT